MGQAEIREIALTVAAITGALGGTVTMGLLSWKALLWLGAHIEREKAITVVLEEFPKLVEGMRLLSAAILAISARAEAADRVAVASEVVAHEERADIANKIDEAGTTATTGGPA